MRIDTKVEMMTTVLHGWFVNTLTERVIHKLLRKVWQGRHDQCHDECGYYKRIMYHDIHLCHMVAL